MRGKVKAPLESGAKVHVSLVGLCLLGCLNEGTLLRDSVEAYREREGHYPRRVLIDKICPKPRKSAVLQRTRHPPDVSAAS